MRFFSGGITGQVTNNIFVGYFRVWKKGYPVHLQNGNVDVDEDAEDDEHDEDDDDHHHHDADVDKPSFCLVYFVFRETLVHKPEADPV